MYRSGILKAVLVFVLALLAACGSGATPTAAPRPVGVSTATPGDLAAPVVVSPPDVSTAPLQTQGETDLALDRLQVIQAVIDEPLVLGKDTVVRAFLSSSGTGRFETTLDVTFEGKTFSQSAVVEGKQTIVDVYVGTPAQFGAAITAAEIKPTGAVVDPDPSNNAKTMTLPTIRTAEKITAYFLPVDWTPEQRERYNFDQSFPKFVRDNSEFLHGTYPLADDQIVVDYTMVPHMLTASEKRLATNTGSQDNAALHLLYASISLAARRRSPDATLVVGVLPPGWFAKHGSPSTLGMALNDVTGTVTAQYVLSDASTSAHELAHLYWLYEDYDYAVDPARPFTWLDRPGFFVLHKEFLDPTSKQIATFLSSYAPDKPFWVDTRTYEYLLAKFTLEQGGEVSEPLVLAATLARQVETNGEAFPSRYSAGYQRFEPHQAIYLSVAAAGMSGIETLEARWYAGNRQLFVDEAQVKVGNGWYSFSRYDRQGMAEGQYRVDVYLDGKQVKTARFEVKASK